MRYSRKVLLFGAALSSYLTACGSADFSGSTSSRPGTADAIPPGPDGLKWLWTCAADDQASADEATIEGVGPHKISKRKFNGKPVMVSGELCQPPKTNRDIVFVVDVSGSMGAGGLINSIFNPPSDPLSGGSCGRLNAIREVIRLSAGQGGARFGVVTFSSGKVAASTNLFADENSLFSDLLAGSGKSNISQIICAADGNTNYDEGLKGGWNLLSGVKRTDAVQEMYFISDGIPDPAQYDGIAVSKEIRKGASLATVMLGNANDTTMKEYIASRDAANKPYHAHAANASELTKVLSKLANNTIQGGTMQYRPVGQTAWTDIDLTPHISGTQFNAPAFKADPSTSPSGIEIHFTYWDRFGHKFENSGTIVWEEDTRK